MILGYISKMLRLPWAKEKDGKFKKKIQYEKSILQQYCQDYNIHFEKYLRRNYVSSVKCLISFNPTQHCRIKNKEKVNENYWGKKNCLDRQNAVDFLFEWCFFFFFLHVENCKQNICLKIQKNNGGDALSL